MQRRYARQTLIRFSGWVRLPDVPPKRSQMNKYRSVLSALFVFEVVIGFALAAYGLYSGSVVLSSIGLSVAAAHLVEKFLLSKV